MIDLAGKAARDGDFAAAYEYERQIESLGVEIISCEEVHEFMVENGGEYVDTNSTEVYPPPNSSRVHFYKSTSLNYYYNNNRYDIVTIQAVSWDDTSDWLHCEGTIKSNQPTVYDVVSGLGMFVVETVVGEVSSGLMTVAGVLSAIGEGSSQTTTLTIQPGETVCTYAIDMDVKFQWIRPHGNGDYVLRVREARYAEINYGISLLTTTTLKNGSTKTFTVSDDFEKSYTPSNYGSLARVCQAYVAGIGNRNIVDYYVPDYDIIFLGKTTIIPSMQIPPYMDSL